MWLACIHMLSLTPTPYVKSTPTDYMPLSTKRSIVFVFRQVKFFNCMIFLFSVFPYSTTIDLFLSHAKKFQWLYYVFENNYSLQRCRTHVTHEWHVCKPDKKENTSPKRWAFLSFRKSANLAAILIQNSVFFENHWTQSTTDNHPVKSVNYLVKCRYVLTVISVYRSNKSLLQNSCRTQYYRPTASVNMQILLDILARKLCASKLWASDIAILPSVSFFFILLGCGSGPSGFLYLK